MGSHDAHYSEFANAEAEARYWRTLVHDLRDELEEIRASSKDLETELDHDFEATERREAELKASIERLRGDLDDSKGRHQAALREHANTLSHMQRELESVRAAEQSLRTRVRDMEVDNDDLEKSERCAMPLRSPSRSSQSPSVPWNRRCKTSRAVTVERSNVPHCSRRSSSPKLALRKRSSASRTSCEVRRAASLFLCHIQLRDRCE
jgi:hypothetical protein